MIDVQRERWWSPRALIVPLIVPVVAPLVAFLLLGFCWSLTSPPGVGVDEPSHYIRVVGLAHGQLLGRDVPADRPLGDLSAEQLLRVNAESGAYDLPGDQREPLPCNVFEPTQPFNCGQYPVLPGTAEHVSFHAKYLPGAYIVPAIFARFGTSMWRTVLLARLGFLIQNAVLFAVTLLAVRRRQGSALPAASAAMLALTATPVLAFQAGTIAPSATEILSSAAFAAAVGAMVVSPRGWRWVAVATGTAACWARDLGVIAVVVAVAAWALADPSTRDWWRSRGRRDVVAVAVLAFGAVGAVLWQLTMKVALEPRPDSASGLWRDLGAVPALLHDSIGLLGWLNYRIDRLADAVWTIAWLLLLVVVVQRADRSTRRVLAGIAVVYVGLNLVLIDGLRAVGFNAQPRFTLPIVVIAVVVLAGRDRGPNEPGGRWIVFGAPLVALLVAAGQFSALLISAQRHANGLGQGAIDFGSVAWAPPGGWTFAVLLFGLAGLSIVGPVTAWTISRLSAVRSSAATTNTEAS